MCMLCWCDVDVWWCKPWRATVMVATRLNPQESESQTRFRVTSRSPTKLKNQHWFILTLRPTIFLKIEIHWGDLYLNHPWAVEYCDRISTESSVFLGIICVAIWGLLNQYKLTNRMQFRKLSSSRERIAINGRRNNMDLPGFQQCYTAS